MHKTFAVCIALLVLAGCASSSSRRNVDVARRQDYLAAHPESQYSRDIMKGKIVVGMSLDDVKASYNYCMPATEFPNEHAWRCRTPKMVKAHKMGTLVQFDYTDHVASLSR